MTRNQFPWSPLKRGSNTGKVYLSTSITPVLRRALELRSIEVAEERGAKVGLGAILEEIGAKDKNIKRLMKVAAKKLKQEREEHATKERNGTDES